MDGAQPGDRQWRFSACQRGTTRNVTAHEEALAALRLSGERFAKMFRSSPAGIILGRQTDSSILEANDAFL